VPDELWISLRELDEKTLVRREYLLGTDGAFTLRELMPGRYRLAVRSGDLHTSREVEVAAGALASVELELQGLITVVGRVIEPRTRRPVPGMWVFTDSPTDHPIGTFLADRTYLTDEDGRFEIRHVPRGAITIGGQLNDERGRGQVFQIDRTIAPAGGAGEVIDLGELRAVLHPAVSGTPGCWLSVERPGAPATVTEVLPEGPAARAGIVVGDVITAIDGLDVTGARAQDAAMLLRGAPGTVISVQLERGVTATIVLDP
jgi:membrane-associated protease RseP (regulator of RpoE activity)